MGVVIKAPRTLTPEIRKILVRLSKEVVLQLAIAVYFQCVLNISDP